MFRRLSGLKLIIIIVILLLFFGARRPPKLPGRSASRPRHSARASKRATDKSHPPLPKKNIPRSAGRL